MENTKERSNTGECSLLIPIQHIHERSVNPRWNEEFHIHRRPVHHSPVPYLPRSWEKNEVELGELTHNYRSNSLCANPDMTQVTAFHLRNREAKRSLQVSWNGVDLENTDTPKYLGVTLDRTLSYKTHIHTTKINVPTRNNLLKKWANSRRGTNAKTKRTTALALCYSTAEYAAPVWERSTYAHLLNSELNQACRAITGCLKPSNVEKLYLLEGIAPPEIRRSVCARVERTKQVERAIHSLFGHTPGRSRLKSRRSFLTSVQTVHFPANVRVNEWKRRLEEKAHVCLVNLYEDLATGHDSHWLNWRCLNRLSTGYTCCKEQRKNCDIPTRHYMGMRACSRKHVSHIAMLTSRTPLHLGRPSRVQRYSSSMHRAMEEDSLMKRYDDDDHKWSIKERISKHILN